MRFCGGPPPVHTAVGVVDGRVSVTAPPQLPWDGFAMGGRGWSHLSGPLVLFGAGSIALLFALIARRSRRESPPVRTVFGPVGL